jgi:NAD(P)-dependent dehydrogenase (short-subunit alcohol dehydrogenase family)
MKEFNGRVAVVTGAASGIGRAIAERLAGEGMKVVLADIEQGALGKAEAEMKPGERRSWRCRPTSPRART